MKTVLKMLAICMMAGGLGVQSVYAEPLVIQEQGSFSAGGTIITAPGTFDAKKPLDSAGQTYHGDHASVFYQIPENPHKYPIVMLHGAGQSSRTWESTPDGREGFQNIFLRRGFSTYIVDQPRRGDAGRTTVEGTVTPKPDEQMWFNQFRVGVWPDYFKGVQFSHDKEIENAGDQKDTQFVITPPLFSMQGKKENTLRIINATNHQLPGDRESLFWVNVKAIPAMEKDQKNENTLQLAIISRIKMFYRPTHLAMAPEEAPAMLRFRRSGSKLTLINPTPYFITVTNMKAGNSNLPNTMVPPKGEVSVDIPHAVTGDISFQTINDYGALTPRIKATMQ
ncbi:TPA: fimbria/pilus periplasmic chaperone [Escherichia coli]|nr:hypothetical protein [Escherichia coli]HAI6443538.1 fimbria/pilus periplasmic chaperone [Escherichia coli]